MLMMLNMRPKATYNKFNPLFYAASSMSLRKNPEQKLKNKFSIILFHFISDIHNKLFMRVVRQMLDWYSHGL